MAKVTGGTLFLQRSANRSRISSAAARVKVMTRMDVGAMPRTFTICCTR